MLLSDFIKLYSGIEFIIIQDSRTMEIDLCDGSSDDVKAWLQHLKTDFTVRNFDLSPVDENSCTLYVYVDL